MLTRGNSLLFASHLPEFSLQRQKSRMSAGKVMESSSDLFHYSIDGITLMYIYPRLNIHPVVFTPPVPAHV